MVIAATVRIFMPAGIEPLGWRADKFFFGECIHWIGEQEPSPNLAHID